MTEPEKVLATRWRCAHCRRSWSNRGTARQHAARCWYDPANRACMTCEHFRSGRILTSADELVSADICRVGLPMPVTGNRFGDERQTLRIGCESHRVKSRHVNPDVIDALNGAAENVT